MPKIQPRQPLTNWTGDVPSLIAEMKRRAGVRTDRDLATFLGVAQSTVSHWRQREAVPESALLKFEALTEVGGEPAAVRIFAARMVAFRLAEYWHEKLKNAGAQESRWLPYMSVAGSLNLICDAVYFQLVRAERHSKDDPTVIASRLMEDAGYMEALWRWAKEVPMTDALSREMMTPPSVVRSPAIAQWLEEESSMRVPNPS